MVVKLHFKNVCLYTNICAALSLDQRSFLFQWAVVHSGITSQSSKSSDSEYSAIGRPSLSHFFSPGLLRKRRKEFKSQGMRRALKCCVLVVTYLLHTWTHGSYACLHKTCTRSC